MATIADSLITKLGLIPLPGEGGYFRETYRSAEAYVPLKTGNPSGTSRNIATAIYYLLTPETFSALHRLPTDEIYHFYAGDPVEQLILIPNGGGVRVLGSAVLEGQLAQCIVPAGAWQGSRLRKGGAWALMGTTMAPGFEFSQYEAADRQALLREYPTYEELVIALTR